MTDPRPAPYPPDTRAKGWRFELDIERIKQSDTWALASLDVRPWLLMLWSESWGQVPCGSLPADDALIAARIGMAPKAFAKAREALMRGWWPAEDGRLYHDTIAARVQSMLEAKRKEAERKAAYRARMDAERQGRPAVVPQDVDGLPPDCLGTDPGCDDTGTSTGTRRKEEEKGKRKRSPSFAAESIELPPWLDRELWDGWCQERRKRGKPITERGAAEQLKSLDEYRRNGHTPERVIGHAIASGNQGLFPPPIVRGVPQASAPRPIETWEGRPRLTAEEFAASQVAKKRALSAIKILKVPA